MLFFMIRRYSRDPQVQRSLNHAVRDGMAYSVMFGVAESYLSAFAVFLKATTAQISLLTALPALLGSLSQLFSAWLAGRLRKRKPLIRAGVFLQACMWLPMAVLPLLFPARAVELFICCVALYYVGGHFASPPWSSLIGDLVPERRRGRFFGGRTRLMSITTFASLTAAGTWLHYTQKMEYTGIGFAVLFACAFCARIYSWRQVGAMHEPAQQLAPLSLPPLRGLFARLRGLAFARFAIFFAAMNFAVAIASPFFVLYQLRDLGFSYLEFTAITAFYVLVQFLMYNVWGRLADIFGNRVVMAVTGSMIPLAPVLWLILPNFWGIMAIQMLGGAAWSGMSLCAGNYLYDVTPPEQRAAYSAIHQTLSSSAIFCGALVGGFLGTHVPTDFTLFGTEWHFTSGLWIVLVASSVARALAVAIFLPRLKEVRSVRRLSATQLIARLVRMNVVTKLVLRLNRWPSRSNSKQRASTPLPSGEGKG